MKKKLIAILCAIAMLIPMAVMPASALAGWTTYSQPTDIDYSFVVIGDMQYMTYYDNEDDSEYVKSVFDWILNNKETRNIEYVFGLGDTIDSMTTYNKIQADGTPRNLNEWILASTQIHRLDGSIPYTVIRGNHDDEGGYHKYICTEDYVNQMDGFYYDDSKPATLGNSMSNSYRKIEIGGVKYLMLSLDYHADDAVIAWANNVIAYNPDCRVVASVHAYLNGTNNNTLTNEHYSGGFLGGEIGSSNVDNTELTWKSFSGQYFWDNLFSKHENMFMVLCGHDAIPTPVHNVRIGDNGNQVIELLVDTSKYDVGSDSTYGASFAMVVNFREDTNEIQLEYLSPSRIAAGNTAHHLSGEQILLEYQDIAINDLINPTTQTTASARISVENPGLRFKTKINKVELDALITKYGLENVSVGILIAPLDKLGNDPLALTHAFGEVNVDFVDVKVSTTDDMDNPIDFRYNVFPDEEDAETNYTFAGSLANIKIKNLDRKFVGRGYISYVDDGGKTQYFYSGTACVRSIDYVATAALKDNGRYSKQQLDILEMLTVAYYNDPFKEDPFYVAEN